MKGPDTSTRPDNIVTFEVKEPTTLLSFIEASLPEAKRLTLKQYLKHGQVAVNTPVPEMRWDRALEPGDRVMVNTTREFKTLHHPRLKVMYEDDDIIVVNKGYGLLSVETDNKAKNAETAYSILRKYVKSKNPSNKIFIVHRLDQATSGLMLFAKTQEAKDRLQHNWNNMVLERKYIALAEGQVPEDEGVIRSYLAENAVHQMYSLPEAEKERGQLAVTRYKVLSRGQKYSLMEMSLDTGRKNQIRVHLHDLGYPIAGDRRYGAKTSPLHRLCLHARTLRFVHPITRRDMNFTVPEPAGFPKLGRR